MAGDAKAVGGSVAVVIQLSGHGSARSLSAVMGWFKAHRSKLARAVPRNEAGQIGTGEIGRSPAQGGNNKHHAALRRSRAPTLQNRPVAFIHIGEETKSLCSSKGFGSPSDRRRWRNIG